MASEDSPFRLTCPASTCRTDNDVRAEVCERCRLPLSGFARLYLFPAHLFNMGLSAAQSNQMAYARDLFAAVVYWCPLDYEARNALALACFTLGDAIEARKHWEAVLKQSPSNTLAARGLVAIEGEKKSHEIETVK
jgi:hypothetical protein